MRTRLLTLAACLLLAVSLTAQPIGPNQTITVIDSGTACVTAPTACATFDLDASTGGFTFSLSGTATGTITFEATNNGDTWRSTLATNVATGAQATTTTAVGLFTVTNVGFVRVRARATATVTGTWIVTAAKGLGFARAGPTPAVGGSPKIVAYGRATAQIAAVASVVAFTVGPADGSFAVSANILVTTATTHNFTLTVTYTTEDNVSHTYTEDWAFGATYPAAVINTAGTGPYVGTTRHLRAKAATTITVATTGTFTTVVYNVEAVISQIST